jgi:hypothetical protein
MTRFLDDSPPYVRPLLFAFGGPVGGRPARPSLLDLGKQSEIWIGLYTYAAVPNSAKAIVSSDQAKHAWKAVIQQHKPELIAQIDMNKIRPSLIYEWSPQASLHPEDYGVVRPPTNDGQVDIEGPTWTMGMSVLVIDAYTGKPWHND